MAASSDLARVLEQTLNPLYAKEAELNLKNAASTQPDFLTNLLNLIATAQVSLPVRQAAVLFFKNFVRQNWKAFPNHDDEQQRIITPQNRNLIKSEVVALVAMVPPILQLQLGDAIGIIADTDFYEQWLNLVPNIVSRFDPADLVTTNAMLQIAHSVFKRWRPKFRTDELFSEIKYVLGVFSQPYLTLFQQVDELITTKESDQAALKILFDTLLLLLKLYVDLNCQDIPEFFEDNMAPFMTIFHKYLTYNNPLLVTDEDEGAGPLEKTKANICEIVEIYTKKYEDVFPMLPDFVNTTWTLLTTTGLEPKYDILVSKAMTLLTSVVKIERHSHLFSSDDVLRQIIEKIVLPNMTMRTADEELFEDDPLDYIRRDLEGSDSDTRRRSASDFVRGLMDYFEKSVTLIVNDYVNHYLAEYAKNPAQNWRSKDTALFLFSAIAIKSSTSLGGVTSTNILVDICQFWTGNALREFTEKASHPVLKADYIRYIYVFRNQLTVDQLRGILPTLIVYLSNEVFVVYTYAAVTLERLLLLKREDAPVFTKADLAPLLNDLLASLFGHIERDPQPEKLAENDFLMRCLMRVFIVSRDTVGPLLEVSTQHLVGILGEISKNPSNPRFNHYLFECLAALIRFVGPTSEKNLIFLESTMVPQLLGILSQEFMPYVFQLLSQLLESQKTNALSEDYLQLLPPLTNTELWRTKANTIPLVRLLQAYLRRGAANVIQAGKLDEILGVWQNLNSSKLYDTYGFDLLMTVFLEVPMQNLTRYVPEIFRLLLMRLQRSRTDRFVFRFAELIYFLSAVDKPGLGPVFAHAAIDQQGPGLFGQLLQMFIIPKTPQIKGREQVITTIVGITRFLTELHDLQSGQYARFWSSMLTAMVQLRQATIGPIIPTDEIEEVDIEETGFQATYVRLAVAGPPSVQVVPFASVDDAVRDFVAKLAAADSSVGGALVGRIRNEATPETKVVLSGWGVVV